MILLRKIKFFVQTKDDNEFSLPKPFKIKESWVRSGYKLRIVIEDSSSFSKEFNSRKSIKTWKDSVKKLRTSLKKGYIYYDNPDNKDGDGKLVERTHYYPLESSNNRYYVSKDINPNDRLMYDIYAPVLETDKNTDEIYVKVKVVLKHCTGHTHRSGKKFSKAD